MKWRCWGSLFAVLVPVVAIDAGLARHDAAQPPSVQAQDRAGRAVRPSPFDAPEARSPSRPASPPPKDSPTTLSGEPPLRPLQPPGISEDQWRQLHRALETHPYREAELSRITNYLSFLARVDRFRLLRGEGTSAAPLTRLAAQLDGELDGHVDRGELGGGEALLLKAALLDVTEPDADRRGAALQAWRAGRMSRTPAVDDQRQADFLRRQADLVAQWHSQPESQRDMAHLQAQLEQLQRSSFGQ
jgi:hypothetical protein